MYQFQIIILYIDLEKYIFKQTWFCIVERGEYKKESYRSDNCEGISSWITGANDFRWIGQGPNSFNFCM